MTLYITSITQLAGIFDDRASDLDRILRDVRSTDKRRQIIAERNAFRECAATVRRAELLTVNSETELREHMKRIG